MTENEQTKISVRGEANRTVEPDQATIEVTITAAEPTVAAASSAVGAALNQLRAALESMDGEPLSAERSDQPLAWTARSIRTYPEHDHDERGNFGPTGRHCASVSVRVEVRDFTRLPALTEALTRDRITVQGVTWSVDDANPVWPRVRADAIRIALVHGQDYAAALGGSVLSVEHVADAGLLDGAGSRRPSMGFASAFSGSADSPGVVLDPEPQTLHAIVEARFSATIGPLPTR